MELTNLTVNQTARNIMQQFSADIEKAHQVGDIHPNGKWVWTQLPSGKYDWRVKKNSGASDEGGSNKNEKKEEKQPSSQKDERFSEDGIVGKDGGFNKQGKTYKRWSDLREKVESGKATPEEKKEFAHLHNQYMNEKERHNYEQSKQSDPNVKEPKYKTVDERREEYKANQGKVQEKNENKGEDRKVPYEKAFDSMTSEKNCKSLNGGLDGLSYEIVEDNKEIGKLLSEGYDQDDSEVMKIVEKETYKRCDKYKDEIVYACNKYGKDNVIQYISDTNENVSEDLAKKIVSKCINAVHSEKKAAEEVQRKLNNGSEQGIKAWKDLTKEEKDAAYTATHDLLKEKLKNTNNESLSWRQGGYEIVQKLSKVYGEKRALKLVLDEASAFQGASQGFIFNTYIKLRVQGYSDEDANKITRNTYKHIAGRDWIDG